ncbi:MAG TPA: peptide chain release factor N(5)-glutamine methyltransferase [Solirubrobacterales bacterium]|nr:peptide chain release factor N(5)-glutamine methyltransferase [Solirubrobacterales bacterium]
MGDAPPPRLTKKSTSGEALNAAVDAFRAAGIADPRLDAEVLLAEATGWDRAHLTANPEAEIPPPAGRRFGEMVRRRLRREPVAYIVGAKWFRRIELAVDPRVLIPRPETELLVELALELAPRSVLDVGTGSGAIALAIADELPGCAVTATDTSAAALEVARANAKRLGLADHIRFLEGAVPADEAFDLTVANLPYVAEPDWDSLAPEVTQWEPREALLAGHDGLDAIRAFLLDRGRHFNRIPDEMATAGRGVVALEVGEGQAGAVGAMLHEAGFATVETRRDLAGIERVVVGRR